MAIDVCITCFSGVDQQLDVVSGRAVTRMPNTRLFKIEPKINTQMGSGLLNSKYDTRFDNPTYYST
jgi:hypothetical protein